MPTAKSRECQKILRFNIKPNQRISKDEFLQNLAMLICQTSKIRHNGLRCQIVGHEDWWFDQDPESEEIIVNHRNGLEKGMAKKMSYLQKTAYWLLCVEHLH